MQPPIDTLLKRHRRRFALAAVLCVAAVLSGVDLMQERLRHNTLEAHLELAVAEASRLDDYLAQQLQSVEIMLQSVAEARASGSRELPAHLTHALGRMGVLRSVSELDASGRVIASTQSGNVGVRVDVSRFYPTSGAAAEVVRIAPPMGGRDWADGVPVDSLRPNADGAHPLAFWPVYRDVLTSNGQWQRWVVALNTDMLYAAYAARAKGDLDSVELWRLDGHRLLVSAPVSDPPADALQALQTAMRQQSSGHDTAVDGQGQRKLLAFRASDDYPVVTLVRYDEATILSQWAEDNREIWWLTAVLLGLGLTLATTLYLRHEQHTRQSWELERQTRLSASVFTSAQEGILITDLQGHILSVNRAFTAISGYSEAEVLGQNPRLLQSGRQSAEFYQGMWKALKTQGHWIGEVWNRRKSGELYAEMLTISTVTDAAGRPLNYVAIFSDITSQKNHQAQLERIAHYDPLTELPNRVLLADRLRQVLAHTERHGGRAAVVFLDLDGFKEVNDRHGHPVGDQLLIALARRLRGALRDGETLARLGGDEFVAVLSDLQQPSDCEAALQRLLAHASEGLEVDGTWVQVSASIGAAIYPDDGTEPDLLMRHADQAMYEAKQAGKNRYQLFDAERDLTTRQRAESRMKVSQALLNGEFVLHYQPKVNWHTGQVMGAEVLVRWQDPERGLVSPGAFLPDIEDHPLGAQLGDWVLSRAIDQLSDWTAAGLQLPLSVNISGRHLQQPHFTQRLSELLDAHPRVRPGDLELEILESSSLDNLDQVGTVMAHCRDMGVTLALDDFGTGYSSLTYLRRLPAQVLKIDQSFVRDMLVNADDLAIVKGVIGLAHAFQREVIAEGVETAEHAQTLVWLGCELMQGYGIAKPMPAEALLDWVDRWNHDTGRRKRIAHSLLKPRG